MKHKFCTMDHLGEDIVARYCKKICKKKKKEEEEGPEDLIQNVFHSLTGYEDFPIKPFYFSQHLNGGYYVFQTDYLCLKTKLPNSVAA